MPSGRRSEQEITLSACTDSDRPHTVVSSPDIDYTHHDRALRLSHCFYLLTQAGCKFISTVEDREESETLTAKEAAHHLDATAIPYSDIWVLGIGTPPHYHALLTMYRDEERQLVTALSSLKPQSSYEGVIGEEYKLFGSIRLELYTKKNGEWFVGIREDGRSHSEFVVASDDLYPDLTLDQVKQEKEDKKKSV